MNLSNEMEVAWLSFRLRNGQSVGPENFKFAWSEAAETGRCAVQRRVLSSGRSVHSLYGPGFLISLQGVIERMRTLLTRETTYSG